MRRVLSLALALFVAGVATSMAENYPSRPITIVVPFPAGGPTDALGRVLADRMKRALNEPVIVENLVSGPNDATRALGAVIATTRFHQSNCWISRCLAACRERAAADDAGHRVALQLVA